MTQVTPNTVDSNELQLRLFTMSNWNSFPVESSQFCTYIWCEDYTDILQEILQYYPQHTVCNDVEMYVNLDKKQKTTLLVTANSNTNVSILNEDKSIKYLLKPASDQASSQIEWIKTIQFLRLLYTSKYHVIVLNSEQTELQKELEDAKSNKNNAAAPIIQLILTKADIIVCDSLSKMNSILQTRHRKQIMINNNTNTDLNTGKFLYLLDKRYMNVIYYCIDKNALKKAS